MDERQSQRDDAALMPLTGVHDKRKRLKFGNLGHCAEVVGRNAHK
jgi:hypothetical protein